jgi:DNA-binding NtrC family response regulator
MSKTTDYRPDNLEQQNPRAGADLRLRLLTLKDLAHAFLEELGTVGDGGGAAAAEAAEGPIDFYDEVRRFEVEMIQSALRRTNGVQTEAALLLGLKPSTLHAKIKQIGRAHV